MFRAHSTLLAFIVTTGITVIAGVATRWAWPILYVALFVLGVIGFANVFAGKPDREPGPEENTMNEDSLPPLSRGDMADLAATSNELDWAYEKATEGGVFADSTAFEKLAELQDQREKR